MSFFTNTSKLGGNPAFEPKRKFRWIVSFSSIGGDESFMCKSMKKPSVTMAPEKHNFMNHEFKYPTKAVWEDIDVVFVDAFQANMGSRFYNMLRSSGYKQPLTMDDALVGFTKAQMAQSVGTITLRQLDGGGVDSADPTLEENPNFLVANIREEWVLKNALLTKVSFGEGLSYTENGLVEVSVGIAYDYATYTEMNVPYPVSG